MSASYVVFQEKKHSPEVVTLSVFNYDDIPSIDVEGYEDGIFKIVAPVGAYIDNFAKFIAGIFEQGSNVPSYICEWLKVPVEEFKGVSFSFNKVPMTVTKENASPEGISKEWNQKWKKLNPRKLWW